LLTAPTIPVGLVLYDYETCGLVSACLGNSADRADSRLRG